LESARRDLAHFPGDVLTVPCDVSDRAQVARLVEAALEAHGRIDVLVNNAGLIQVGPAHTMTVEDFETAMDTMFWGTVYTTLAALPHMRGHGQGRIVNITSVGAKVSIPHLLPYSCAKFAAAAFSEGLRAELHGTGVKVVTIAPGLMRTGSYLNAIFKGAEEGEAAWFSLGASLPGISMSAKRAARQIIAATASGRAERILSLPANFIARFHGMFPGLTSEILGLVNRVLPHGSERTERGDESAVLQKPVIRALTVLGRRAAERLQPVA
jgi:NAD(P)-dependent dehydrogenase (short-subunit alcohol dehydrogenase family)